jgi:hypothetical protein
VLFVLDGHSTFPTLWRIPWARGVIGGLIGLATSNTENNSRHREKQKQMTGVKFHGTTKL